MYVHAQAPVRIGIAGGGSDLPAWTQSGKIGRCLTLAIASYTHAIGITRLDRHVVAVSRRLDEAAMATEIGNGLVRETALLHDWETGFEIHTMSELSSRGTGLGVSSSIAVALSACFRHMSDVRDHSRYHNVEKPLFYTDAAKEAWHVEIDRLRRPIGRQDHMAAAWGGLRLFNFNGDQASVERSFTREDAEWLAAHLALVELPTGHDSASILQNVTTPEMVVKSFGAVDAAVAAIEHRNVRPLGEALLECLNSKMSIPGSVDDVVLHAVTAIASVSGARGCKVAGAGGGGHMVVAIDNPQVIPAIAQATKLPCRAVTADHVGVQSEAHL